MRPGNRSPGASESPSLIRGPTGWALLAGGLLLAGVVAGCSGATPESERPDPSRMVDSGSWYVREPWPHDGNPYGSEHFVVYSDGASTEARRRLASLAEEEWATVIDAMGIDPATMFRFPADQDKVDLFANRYNLLEGGGARAYYAGVLIPSFDHEAGPENTDVAAMRVTLKHELVHVAEALLKGRFVGDVAPTDPRRMPVWFSEGTAEALSGGSTGGPPRTLDVMNGLIARYGRINPIAWRVDLPISDEILEAYSRYYYPMAHLAVDYLLDSKGLGRSPEDLAAVMSDMGNDVPFAEAFESHIGISQSDYEAQFFTLMDAYLPQSEFPFEAVGLGLAALSAAGLVGGVVVWGMRRSPASASSATAVPGWGRRARGGFVTELSILALVAVGLVARALFGIGFDDLPPGANRTLGYALTAGYCFVSVGILAWAIRRWRGGSRSAYAIPLLVVAASLITAVLIDWIL